MPRKPTRNSTSAVSDAVNAPFRRKPRPAPATPTTATAERCKQLFDALDALDARLLWDAKVNGGEVRGYEIRGRMVVVQIHRDGHGWEVYRPVTASVMVDETLAALTAYATAEGGAA